MFLATLVALAAVAASPAQPLRPVPVTQVELTDSFWAPRLEINRTVTLPHVLDKCESTGRIKNFEVAAKACEGTFTGYCFNDSDLYKTIEGAAIILATHRDPALEARCDAIIDKIAAAQEPDGYLYTQRIINDPNNQPPGGPKRWSDMAWGHELYCMGHLYEAAVAYHQATGKRRLLDIAIKNADLVAATFGPGKDPHPCGHPEIEIALAKLYRETNNQKYLDTLHFFIDTRGHHENRQSYGDYAQDHIPILDQSEAVGHAVRLGYLYSGVMDLAELAAEPKYAEAAARVWDDIVRTKLYVTGGVGSQGNNEGFGAPYDLPNSSAYNETCSSIAFVMWSRRMCLATGDSKYADVLERTLYNAALAGWSLSGDKFFYPNPLESNRGRERSTWFDCACCPPNVVRFIADIPSYAYAVRDRDLYVNLFIGSKAHTEIAGQALTITQTTFYPWDGAISLAVEPAAPTRFALRLRIPGWARGEAVPSDLYRFQDAPQSAPTLTVNGKAADIKLDKGYAVIDREWRAGDRVELTLPMQVQRIVATDRVLADRGRAAIQRGPIVYCFESADQPSPDVLAYVAPSNTTWTSRLDQSLLSGVVSLTAKIGIAERTTDGARIASESEAVAIPYYAWANRKPGAMNVWVATDPAAAKPRPLPTIATRAKPSSSFGGDLSALADQMEPKTSGDHDNPFLHWWPRKGTEEWIQYDFDSPTTVNAVEVYWFDDTGRGECRLPESWTLQYKSDDAWRDVPNPSAYAVAGDTYNRCTFDAIQTSALRINVKSRMDWAGGIHEWRVFAAGESKQPSNPAPQPQTNAIPNPSFEDIADNRPAHWSQSGWAGKAKHELAATGHTGSHSVMISSDEGADAAWSTTIPVEINARYKLSGWIKTDNVQLKNGMGALFNIHALDGARTPAVTGTSDWKHVEIDFDTGDNDAVMVNCLFGGWGLATGKAWFDDVSLTLLSKGPTPTPRISIDAAATAEPISPYIYGQFIEHLGKCIYGGIWAEMLEDRKFFYPVGSPESPWKPIGDAKKITMSDKEPFVGAHSPLISSDGSRAGIMQSGLALKKGMSYTGRIWLSGDVPVSVTLVWGDAAEQRRAIAMTRATPPFAITDLKFDAPENAIDARLEIATTSRGSFRIGAVSLMPADNIHGFRADTLALLKELDSPVYRWPGGNFVSGYNWRDGVGDRDRRPPRKNPAWSGVEHNDVGIHEFLDLCDLLHTQPYIAVNTGLGTVDNAAAEIEYVNGAPATPMGSLRAQNGRTEPWNVKFWGIGNEMYGSWQLGNVPLSEYTKRHNAYVDALRKVDPTIKVFGVGAAGEWSRTMLRDCADHLDYMSEHVYWQDRPGLLSHVTQAPTSLRHIADAHRRYRKELDSLKGRDIRIVQDEWNYWYGPHVFGELGTRYFMKDALGCAAALNEFGRNSDLFFMANYAQTVNVIGAIKTSKTNAALETTGLVLKLYRHHLGVIPCKTESSPTIDALAAWSADRRTLTIGVVNISTKPAEIALDLRNTTLTGSGVKREIASDDPMAYNDPDHAGGQPVQIRETPVNGITSSLSVAPCSVTVFSLPVR